jgi:hypothetical protein
MFSVIVANVDEPDRRKLLKPWALPKKESPKGRKVKYPPILLEVLVDWVTEKKKNNPRLSKTALLQPVASALGIKARRLLSKLGPTALKRNRTRKS